MQGGYWRPSASPSQPAAASAAGRSVVVHGGRGRVVVAGSQLYGDDAFDDVRKHLLPAKTRELLVFRVASLTRQGANDISRFRERRSRRGVVSKKWSGYDDKILALGAVVHEIGTAARVNWEEVAPLLPHRAAGELRKRWAKISSKWLDELKDMKRAGVDLLKELQDAKRVRDKVALVAQVRGRVVETPALWYPDGGVRTIVDASHTAQSSNYSSVSSPARPESDATRAALAFAEPSQRPQSENTMAALSFAAAATQPPKATSTTPTSRGRLVGGRLDADEAGLEAARQLARGLPADFAPVGEAEFSLIGRGARATSRRSRGSRRVSKNHLRSRRARGRRRRSPRRRRRRARSSARSCARRRTGSARCFSLLYAGFAGAFHGLISFARQTRAARRAPRARARARAGPRVLQMALPIVAPFAVIRGLAKIAPRAAAARLSLRLSTFGVCTSAKASNTLMSARRVTSLLSPKFASRVSRRGAAKSFSEAVPSAQIEVKLANVFLLGNAAPNNARKGIGVVPFGSKRRRWVPVGRASSSCASTWRARICSRVWMKRAARSSSRTRRPTFAC